MPRAELLRSTMVSPGGRDERITAVHCSDDVLTVDLVDGRIISVPLAWYPRLLAAAPRHRARWIVRGDGCAVYWPAIGEEIGTAELLQGVVAAAPT